MSTWFGSDKLPSASSLRQKADKFNVDVEARLVDVVLQAADAAAATGKYDVAVAYDDAFRGKFGPDITVALLVKHSHGAIAKLKSKDFSATIEGNGLVVSWALTPAL